MHTQGLGPSLPMGASHTAKAEHYTAVLTGIRDVLADEQDWCAAMATVSCILHASFDYYDWTGFYRTASKFDAEDMLVIGPYQGSLGCLRIPFSRGVCGAAASSKQTQLVPDVHLFPGHIACASSTQSEVVVPVQHPSTGDVVAVLDIDSNEPAAFDAVDAEQLEQLCAWLASKYFSQHE